MQQPLMRPLDALIASDPGLSRLRMGLAGAVCVSAVLAVELLVGTAMGLPAPSLMISMILGAVIAMMGSNALARPSARESIRAAVFFPVAIGLGLGIGTLVGDHVWLSRVVFVLVMFGAVFVRRFGLDFFFSGFLAWMGYFFSQFLHPVAGQLPQLLLAVVIGTAVVLLLCTTVFRPHPRRTLARIFRSMRARRSRLLRLMASRLRATTDKEREKLSRRVFDERTMFNEMVLMSDGWAAHARALPVGWSAENLRRSLLDAQLDMDLVGWSSVHLLDASPRVRGIAARALVLTADGDVDRARRACDLLALAAARETSEPAGSGADAPSSSSAATSPKVRDAVGGLVRGIRETGRRTEVPYLPPTLEPNSEFTPAAALTGLGLLPGPPSVSRDVQARGAQWNPVSRMRATTRQAVQVAIAGALAIAAGTLISGSRYYWAVIAAFVVFTGTGTRMDSFGKSLNRVLGTLLGLVAGILLAALTAGHPAVELAVIVLSVFFGFYLMRISYAYMMFFVTILVAQLYGILGQFSDALLVLRLAETAAGAGIGMLVALLVIPVSTRDTVDRADREVVGAIGELLGAVAAIQRDPGSERRQEIDALLFAVDNAQRRLSLAAAPLTRYYLSEHRPRRVRHRLTIIATCVSLTRTVTSRAMALSGPRARVAAAGEDVAALAQEIAGLPEASVEVTEAADGELGGADDSSSAPRGSLPAPPPAALPAPLGGSAPADPVEDAVLESLASLGRTLHRLETTPVH